LTKNVLETALDAETTEHLAYHEHDPVGAGAATPAMALDPRRCSPRRAVEIEVPRDTNSSLEPQIIKKRQRRLTYVDGIVLSSTAKGLTSGEISVHFADVCGNRPCSSSSPPKPSVSNV
jgi:putative transposase